MRKLTLWSLVTVLVLLPVLAIAAGGAILLDTSNRLEITDCLASGGDAGTAWSGTLTEGSYLLRVTGEDIFVCLASTCVSGGEKFPSGTVLMIAVPRGGMTLSCRGTGSGDLIVTRAAF